MYYVAIGSVNANNTKLKKRMMNGSFETIEKAVEAIKKECNNLYAYHMKKHGFVLPEETKTEDGLILHIRQSIVFYPDYYYQFVIVKG